MQWKPQAIVFGIVTNKKFDIVIMLFIGLNMLTMTLDRYGQSEMWSFALDNLNMGFIVIFTSESILKIFALRQYYFKEPWNVFDFVVVILSILGELRFLISVCSMLILLIYAIYNNSHRHTVDYPTCLASSAVNNFRHNCYNASSDVLDSFNVMLNA